MTDETKPERFSLSRWSRRKLEASRAKPEREPLSEPAPPPASGPAPADEARSAATERAEQRPGLELPSVESLTIDSDFTPFLGPEVDDTLRRAALRKLFRDPRFNVMDGLDVYIDDYTQATPIPEDVLGKLAHARYIFDPPATRMNAHGFIEDVPQERPVLPVANQDPASASAQRPDERPRFPGDADERVHPSLPSAMGEAQAAAERLRATPEPRSAGSVEDAE
jgi:hypothetical protein